MKNNIIKNKIEFQEKFILIDKADIKDDLDYFIDNLFYPIYNKNDGISGLITTNSNLLKNNLNNDKILSIIFKYIKSQNQIYVCNDELYFSILGQEENQNIVSKDAEDFFKQLLQNASRNGASDIHIIWEENGVRIKFRIDGVMVNHGSLISFELGENFKNLCVVKANESEYEKNEVAGKFKMLIDHKNKEYRLSIIPTVKGYTIVIRQASYLDMNTSLEDWGYTNKAINLLRKATKNYFGMILATGPTGSGKSTLLYTLTIEEKRKNKIIKTAEDPVEVEINGVDQVQVNLKGDEKSHLTFAKVIKVFLRQDPDVIVVGEIRDLEVATTAFTAAKTGHLCMSTLHTNDVESTISRLFDLGIEQLDLEDSLKCIISQRLIPKLCDNCKIKIVADDGTIYYKRNEKGCNVCANSKILGNIGRIPIVEIALMSNNRFNYKKENFIDYYSLEENIIDLMEDGKIDANEAGKYIELNEVISLNKRKEILKIWNRIISKIDKKKYLIPHYQKMVDSNQIINGYEVFGRLRNLKDELYNPNEFIPILKNSNLYNEATNYLFNEVFNKNKSLDLNFFINVDHTNLSSEKVIKNIIEKINNTMVPNVSKFILETNYNSKYFIEDVILAHKHNLAISLDNFDGSVVALQRIKKHNLKIDYVKTYKDFIIGFSNNEQWVESYMKILQELNSKIIITNIENKEIFEKLKNRYGNIISYYQGYYFGKPLETINVL